MTDIQEQPIEVWGIVSQMGHKTLAGRITEVERFGGIIGRVEVPVAGTDQFREFLFGRESLYGLKYCTEAEARRVAANIQGYRPYRPELAAPLDAEYRDADEDPDLLYNESDIVQADQEELRLKAKGLEALKSQTTCPACGNPVSVTFTGPLEWRCYYPDCHEYTEESGQPRLTPLWSSEFMPSSWTRLVVNSSVILIRFAPNVRAPFGDTKSLGFGAASIRNARPIRSQRVMHLS